MRPTAQPGADSCSSMVDPAVPTRACLPWLVHATPRLPRLGPDALHASERCVAVCRRPIWSRRLPRATGLSRRGEYTAEARGRPLRVDETRQYALRQRHSGVAGPTPPKCHNGVSSRQAGAVTGLRLSVVGEPRGLHVSCGREPDTLRRLEWGRLPKPLGSPPAPTEEPYGCSGTANGRSGALHAGRPGARRPGRRPHYSAPVQRIADILEKIKANYVEPIDDSKLVTNAVNGVLHGLDPIRSISTPRRSASSTARTAASTAASASRSR